ncbi:MAG: choice-of-anchor D domain-containing protein [Bacteroidota bacterium]
MKSLPGILMIVLLGSSFVWAQPSARVVKPNRADKSSALRDIVRTYRAPAQTTEIRVVPLQIPAIQKDPWKRAVPQRDPALQDWQGAFQPAAMLLNFEGLGEEDNINVTGYAVVPPDPNGDVGPMHYVQMINDVFAVYDKSGNLVFGPFINRALWDGFGGPCESRNDGDPIVIYDPLADRWLLTQFVFGEKQCVACSETGDPTGAYFRYEFDAPGNDYPKHGVWPDAYTFTYLDFSNIGAKGYSEATIGAMEREKILAGDPSAKMVLFSVLPTLGGTEIFHVLPADLDGPPPPPGTPSVFVGHQDDALTGAPNDRLAIWELNVNWTSTDSSTLDGPFFLPTQPFNMGGSIYVPQPFPGELLYSLSFVMMHRLAFRDLGTHMAMVTNHCVDVGDFDDHAGIRWYELRNEGSGWSIFQQGTYAPDSDHRWNGSIAMDSSGNIALGYSVSGDATFPSLRYTGHTVNAPPGVMNVAEQNIFEGSGSQINSFGRWGDYSMMAVDPTDDVTFWYTNEYYAETSRLNFRTRIGSFSLEPLTGNQIQVLPALLDFGNVPLGQTPGTATVTISNIGDVNVTVTGISDPGDHFTMSNVPGLPVTIPMFGSEKFEVAFDADLQGSFASVITVSSNDPNDSTVDVTLRGKAVALNLAEKGVFYGTLGLNDPNPGSLITIDVATGAGTLIGTTGISHVPALAIKSTGEVFVADPSTDCRLWRVDAASGASVLIAPTGLFYIHALAFDVNDVLYAVDMWSRDLYIVNDSTAASTLIGSPGVAVRGLAFDPTDNTLWASVGGEDSIFTIDVSTGSATLVGKTGLGGGTPDLCFDRLGNLYASKGGGDGPNNLISIDKSTGAGSVIGPIGFTSVSGLATRIDTLLVGIHTDNLQIPVAIALHQNYPNPFNPSTTIEFALPHAGFVTLRVYNILGEEVATLINSDHLAGGMYQN